MSDEQLLLDTVYVQALLNRTDQHHAIAKSLLSRVQSAREVWITEADLVEIANALSAIAHPLAVAFIRQCYTSTNIRVVPVDTALLICGLELYAAHPDKTWSLTDCISMIVMQDQNLFLAVTADHHFIQAGFQAIMLTS